MSMNTMVFSPAHSGQEKTDFREDLLSALNHMFLSVVKLELNTGKAWLLQSLGQKNQQCYEFEWERYLEFYQSVLEEEESCKLQDSFSISKLRNLCREEDKKSYSLDFACKPETGMDWLEIIAYFESEDKNSVAYIFTRQNGDNYLLRHIIDLYVYNNCDYFIYLDAKNNSYTMSSGSKSGTPLPPAVCLDYSSEIVKYADDFVVPEDRDMVIREMSLDRVMEVLEEQEVHAFTCGVWQADVGYTRKRLEYRYYNRKQKMILLSRSDITEIYEEQQRHAQDLEAALEQALSDPLTGLLNYQGIRTAVKKGLEQVNQMSALLFLDLEDFKSVNDTYGHAAGDHTLQAVAEILKDNIRSTDFASRIGGDEFVVFLSNIRHKEDASDCAKRICEQLSNAQLGEFQLSCSIGVAVAPVDGIDYTALVKKADKKVYQAKSLGKNQFAI